MTIIAGHSFSEQFHGRVCLGYGVRFADITSVQPSDVGKPGFCHQGVLNAAEFDQIIAERDRIWGCVADIASGRGVGGSLPGNEMEGFQ